jgi:tetratricopeptide (TPR) repeat protein
MVIKGSPWLTCLVFGCSLLWLDQVMAQVSINPQQYDLALSKGVLKFNQGEYVEATTFFRQALDAKPGDPDASYYLGQTLIRTKRYQDAERLFRTAVEGDPSSGRAKLGLAMAQYHQEKYQEALSHLKAAQLQLPNDPLVYYFQGLTYIRLGAYDKADAPLTKAIQLSPDLVPEGHYQRGVAQYGLGRYDEAAAEFEAAIAAEPNSELAQAARVYLTQIREGTQGTERRRLDPTQPRIPAPAAVQKRWDLSFSVSPQYDSNVVILPLGVQPPGGSSGISQKSDYRTVFTGRGEYRPLQTDNWTVGTAYGFYQSFHHKLSGFDVQDHTPSVYVQHRYGRFQSRMDYLFDYVTVGRDPFLVSHALRPVFSVREGDNWFTQLQLGYQNKDFKDDRFALNSTRDGKNWLIGVSQFYHFAENAGVVRVGYIYDTDRTGGGSPSVAFAPSNADWAYTGHRFSTGLRLPPVWTLTPDFTFDYYRQNYDNPNFFSVDPNNFSQGGRTVRHDNIYIVTAGVSRPIAQRIFLGLQYSYTRDVANIPLFNYERMVYSLTLSGSF